MTVVTATPQDRALVPFQEIRAIADQYPRERFHLLLPTTMMAISPLFIPTPTAVVVNPDDPRDVYDTPGGGGTVCFHSGALERIANAGGLDFDPKLEVHDHNLKESPLVCRMNVGGWYIDSLGQRRLVGDGVTHDLRDDSARTKLLGGANAKPVQVARQFICEQARSRARNRVIRKCMNLASSYRRNELLVQEQVDGKPLTRPKPFVAIRFRLNDEDEDVKKAIIQRHFGVTQEVFGRTEELPAASAHDDLDDTIEDHAVRVDDEPGIAEPTPAPKAEAPKPAPADASAIAAAATAKAKSIEGAQDKASDEFLATVGAALRDALQVGNLETKGQIAVRLAIARGLYGAGMKSVRELTAAQARVIVEMAKDPQGQTDLATVLRERLQLGDPVLEPYAELLKPHLAHA